MALAARWLHAWSREKIWAVAQGLMAAGTAMPSTCQSLWGMAASAVLVGGLHGHNHGWSSTGTRAYAS